MRRAVAYLFAPVFCGIVMLYSGCAANEAILKSNTSTSSEPAANSQPTNVEPSKSTHERELEAMRTADFDYIFVLRRKDGAKMDDDDRAVVRLATAGANRRSLSDDDKVVMVGTNYPIAPDKIKILTDQFDVQDFSKPPAERKPISNSTAPNTNTAPIR